MRTTEYLPLDTIRVAERNPKLHDMEEIKASLRRFGYADTAILDERTERLVGGHGRLEGLRELRDAGETPPEYVTTGPDGAWLVPVQRGWSSGSDAEAEAMGVALNRLTETGGWDTTVLVDILDGLLDTDAELTGVGFDEDTLDGLIMQMRDETLAFRPERGDGSQVENDINERAAEYARSNKRSLVLDYGLNEFDEMAANCAWLRRRRGFETNAQLVQTLVVEAAALLPTGTE